MDASPEFENAKTPLFKNWEKNKKYVENTQQPVTTQITLDEKKEKNLGARLELRKNLIERRRWLVDVEFAMALSGIVLMILENELYYMNAFEKGTSLSLILKTFTTITTTVLLVAICLYYRTGIEIRMVDGGVDDPFAVTPFWTWIGLITELLICAVHPFPGDIQIGFAPPVGPSRQASIDGILSVLMMFRLYIVGKFIVVHSRLLTDPSTQSIGAVSQVKINLFFVFKSAMTNSPGVVILFVMLTMYCVSVWGMRTCELYYTKTTEGASFTESMWLSAITFLTVGYGDLTPKTHCGRFIAVATGLMGLGSTALLVAVLARRLEQSRSERYVYNFLTRIHLENKRKHAAADVVKFAIKLSLLTSKKKKSRTALTYWNWKLRNSVRTMRLARASLAEIEEASVGLIEISQMVTRVSNIVDTSLHGQNRLMRHLQSVESEIANLRKELRASKNNKE